ncbi:hypothetical protein N658DRAFT_497914, partial [Parathielavia hyrcaniae]
MSRRSKTQCSRHAGTATRTSSTNLTSFHHMIFGRGALCRWGRVVATRGWFGLSVITSLTDPTTTCS